MRDGVDLGHKFEHEREIDREVNDEGEYHSDEKPRQRAKEITEIRLENDWHDESEYTNGGETNDELSQLEHDLLGARPKLLLGFTLRFGQFADEGSKENGKGNHAQQLSVICSGVDDVGWEHAEKDFK